MRAEITSHKNIYTDIYISPIRPSPPHPPQIHILVAYFGSRLGVGGGGSHAIELFAPSLPVPFDALCIGGRVGAGDGLAMESDAAVAEESLHQPSLAFEPRGACQRLSSAASFAL